MEIKHAIEELNAASEQWYRQQGESERLQADVVMASAHCVDSVLEFACELDAGIRSAIRNAINRYARKRLLAYAQERAEAAVRNDRPSDVERGLCALGLEGGAEDWRTSIVVMAMLCNSATRLGLHPVSFFEKAAAIADSEFIAGEILKFLDRAPRERDIAAFNVREVIDDEGFHYEQTSW